MEIIKENGNLTLIWHSPVSTLTSVKKNKRYHSFRVTFPLDLKNYIEHNVGSLEKISFYEVPFTSLCPKSFGLNDSIVPGLIPPEHNSHVVIIDSGTKLPKGSEHVADVKLVSFKKESQLFMTLSKKVFLFKSMDVDVKFMLKYSLFYDCYVDDYVLMVSVVAGN